MKRAILAGLLLALAPVTGLSAQNWDGTYAATAGGHRLGNPQAATHLIAFVSYSCPHCATFEVESDAGLRLNYIATGKVSLEVRQALRNELDLAATLTTECGPEDKFWDNHRAMFRDQPRWMAVAQGATRAQTARWSSGTLGSRMRAIASDLGFYRLMEPRGYTVADLDQCLSNEAAARLIATSSQADAERWHVAGTPSFAINDALLNGVHNWASLQTALENAVR